MRLSREHADNRRIFDRDHDADTDLEADLEMDVDEVAVADIELEAELRQAKRAGKPGGRIRGTGAGGRPLMLEARHDQLERARRDRELGRRIVPVNVSKVERWINLAAGAGLIGYGVWRRDKLGAILGAAGGVLGLRAATGYCPAYHALKINMARRDGAEPEDYYDRGIHVVRSVTVQAPREKLWDFWRDLENLPRIMSHLKSVSVIDDRRSRWVARGPMGADIEWDAEIINERPPELLAWRSMVGAEVDNAGSVRFIRAPNGRGTQVKVNLHYIPAGGKAGKIIAALFSAEPSQQIREDLRRFKHVAEAGEVPRTGKQPHGQCSG